MNEQILKLSAEVLVAEFLQRHCELPAAAASSPTVDCDHSSVINRVFESSQNADWENNSMINGAHVIIYSKDADADRAFFKDVLGFHHVDAGHGWLIFALPPAEVACHPADENDQHQLYLMCEDLKQTMSALDAKGIHCGEVQEPPWGVLTTITLPGGGKLGLYQPKHPTAAELKSI